MLTDATGSGDGPLLMQFLSLSADDLRTGLAEAGATFDRLGAQDSLAVKIPLLNKSVSELLAGDAEPAVFSGASVLEAYAESDVGRFTVTLKSSVAIGLVAAGDLLQFLAADGTLAEGRVTAVDAASRRFVVRYDAERLSAPATNEPEVRLAVGTEIIRLAGNDVEAVASVERLQRYRYRLETAGDSVRSLGVKPGDTVRFTATGGDLFTAVIDGLSGEDVVIRYAADRADRPDLVQPVIELLRPARLSAQWTAGLGALADDAYAATHVATVQDLLVELGGLQGLPLADAVSVLQLDAATGVLTLTHALTPQPLAFTAPLDLTPQIPGLEIGAAGQITSRLAPQLRIPLTVGLRQLRSDGAALGTKVAVKADAAPELSCGCRRRRTIRGPSVSSAS